MTSTQDIVFQTDTSKINFNQVFFIFWIHEKTENRFWYYVDIDNRNCIVYATGYLIIPRCCNYNMVTDETLILEGSEVDKFLEYDQRELSVDEKQSLKEAHDLYKKYCKS